MVDESRLFKHKNVRLAGSQDRQLPGRRAVAERAAFLPDRTEIAITDQEHLGVAMLHTLVIAWGVVHQPPTH